MHKFYNLKKALFKISVILCGMILGCVLVCSATVQNNKQPVSAWQNQRRRTPACVKKQGGRRKKEEEGEVGF